MFERAVAEPHLTQDCRVPAVETRKECDRSLPVTNIILDMVEVDAGVINSSKSTD
jgi:hypothetical protein